MPPENDYLVYFVDGQTSTRANRITATSAREAAQKVLENRDPGFQTKSVGQVVTISLQTFIVRQFLCSRQTWIIDESTIH